jgi:hypothetical protein
MRVLCITSIYRTGVVRYHGGRFRWVGREPFLRCVDAGQRCQGKMDSRFIGDSCLESDSLLLHNLSLRTSKYTHNLFRNNSANSEMCPMVSRGQFRISTRSKDIQGSVSAKISSPGGQ